MFLLVGDPIVGNDKNGRGGEKFEGYTYAVRSRCYQFKSENGCLLLETHSYNDET